MVRVSTELKYWIAIAAQAIQPSEEQTIAMPDD
jgi:hypothetical protein